MTARAARVPRTGRRGRPARVMSHRARSALARPPVEAADRVASVVGAAFATWAERFVGLVMRDLVAHAPRFKLDATVVGLFNEAGRAKPDPDKIATAFKLLETQSADELRVAGVPTRDVLLGAEAKQAAFVRQNTDLIKAEADLRRRVERILHDPLNEGRSVADISRMLQEQAGYSQSRAELTARDQTLKLYGQIQEARQTSAGITKYVWTTSLDERVRPDHAELDGTVQEWANPPIADKRTGTRAHPGIFFQCRCTAVPVLDDDVEAQPEDAPPPPRESAMVPTSGELEAHRAAVAAEQARRVEEIAAEQRIAAARAAPVAPITPAAEAVPAEAVALHERAQVAAVQRAITLQRVAAAVAATEAVAVPEAEPAEQVQRRAKKKRRR